MQRTRSGWKRHVAAVAAALALALALALVGAVPGQAQPAAGGPAGTNEIATVPLMTLKVLEAAQEREFDLSSLTVVFSSGGAAPRGPSRARTSRDAWFSGAWRAIRLGALLVRLISVSSCLIPQSEGRRIIRSVRIGRIAPPGVRGSARLIDARES